MRPERRGLLIAGAAYMSLLLWLASHFGTWSDEEYTLATTAHGAAYAWHRAIDYELQAPIYFAFLGAWREIDPSVSFARLFSILCATGFFFVVAKIARRVAPTADPLLFAVLAAVNPYVVFDALEIRLYALALLLSAVLWLAFDAGFANGRSLRARIAFVCVAIFSIGVQYFMAFLLIGFAAALIVLGKPKAFFAYVAYSLAVVVAILPLALVARSQMSQAVQSSENAWNVLYLTALHPWLEFLLPHPYSVVEPRMEHIVYAVLAVVVAFCCFWLRPTMSRRLLALIATFVTVELVYMALAVSIPERLGDRYFVALFVPCFIAVYALVRSGTGSPVPRTLVAGTVTVLTAISLVTHYRYLAQNGDWPRVAAFLETHAAAGDVIAIYPSEALPAFDRQYRGETRVVPFPRPNPTDRYVVDAVDVHSKADAREALGRLGTYRRLWLVDAINCAGSEVNSYGCDDLHDVLAKQFTTLDRSAFFMNSVVELARSSSAAP